MRFTGGPDEGTRIFHGGAGPLLAWAVIAASLALPSRAEAQAAFAHPGILHTSADIERIKERVAANAEPYVTGWERVRTDSRASLDYTPQPYAIVQRTPDRVSYEALIQDVHAAQLHTIRWVVSGEQAHAQKAAAILDAWSSTLTSIPSTGEPVLAAGIAGYQLVAAAETLRATYPAWETGAQDRLKTKLLTIFYPPLHNFLIYHDGDGLEHTDTGVNVHFYTNWDAAAMVTIGAIGVFADDRSKYQEALDAFTNGTGNGNITRAVYDANTGQPMEAGRDPEHAQLGIGLLGTLAEIAWNQGDDLYGYDSNRLLKGFEYMASYLLGNEVPFATYSDAYRTHTVISQEASADQITNAMTTPRPIYEMAWNHYVQRRCVPAPFTQQLAELKRPEGFRADHIGYGTLLHARDQDCSSGSGGAGQAGAGAPGTSGAATAAGAEPGGSGSLPGGGSGAAPSGAGSASGGANGLSGERAPSASDSGCSCHIVAASQPSLSLAPLLALGALLARRRGSRTRQLQASSAWRWATVVGSVAHMPAQDKTPEREQTDESLRVEREKADADLGEKQAAIEEAADAIIEKARSRADQVLADARAKSDLQLGRQSALSAKVTEKEREREDHALRQERASADETLREERAEHVLPSPEREATDKDLSHERARSDHAVTARDAFLGIVSHDLRNLLNGMVGFATLIAKGLVRDNYEDQIIAYAQRITRTGARMNRLVGDLVDVASIEAGVLAVRREVSSPALVVTEAVDNFQALASGKGISLTAELMPSLPVVSFDPARILQVLVNLLSNAIKFTPPNGKVVVGVEGVAEELRFKVTDTGEGIPPAKLEAIFDRFLQLTENDRRGVGLGLYISKCIVQGHGGRIWAESTPGKGSTFFFTIPIF